MGFIVRGKELWKALFTRTQRRLLGLLFGHPERSFYANEIVRLAGVGTGAVQRELAKLTTAGLLRVRRVGNQKHYQANRDCLFYPEIRAMVVKAFGSLEMLRAALHGLDGEIELAFLYGPGEGTPPESLMRLMVISPDLRRPDMEVRLKEAGDRIGSKIALVLLRPDKFQDLLRSGDVRLREALDQTGVVLIGALS